MYCIQIISKESYLFNRWALWYFKPDKNKDWKDNLKLVISFDTVSFYTDRTLYAVRIELEYIISLWQVNL